MFKGIHGRSGWVATIPFVLAAWSTEAQMHGGHSTHDHGGTVSEMPTATDVADAVEDYVRHDVKMKGGYFLFYDSVLQAPLVLTLKRVHEDGLRMMGDDEYFTSVDFESADGSTYGLDIFVKGPDKAHLEVSAISVYKENDTLRYEWLERDGVWRRKQVARIAPNR